MRGRQRSSVTAAFHPLRRRKTTFAAFWRATNRQGRDEGRIIPHCDDRVMMTQQLEVSIIAAPLAAIDRRALSEAWYAALQCAKEGTRAPATPPRDGRSDPPVYGRARNANVVTIRNGAPPFTPHPAASRRSVALVAERAGAPLPGSRMRSSLARRIESTFSKPDSSVRRATFSLGRGSVRVHVILQNRGERFVLLALCPPHARGLVSRALAQARVSLAARGIRMTSRTGVRACS